LQPSIQIKEDKEKILDNIEIELIEAFSSEMEGITFVINVTTSSNCVRLKDFVGQLKSENFILKNESGGIITEVRDHQDDLLIDRNSLNDTLFRIYNSEEFGTVGKGNLPGCQLLSNDSYIFKSANINNEIFLSKINDVILDYWSNYSSLKENLSLEVSSNFGFSFTDKKTILIETPDENVSTSVYAEEIPVLFVDSEADINPGFLTIKVW
jgi:hypothetical protein